MNFNYIFPLLFFLFSFVFSTLIFQYCTKFQKNCFSERIITTITLLFASIYGILQPDTHDFISNLNIYQNLCPFVITCLLSFFYYKPINLLLRILLFTILSSVIIFGLNLNTYIFTSIHPYINRIFAVFIWVIITTTFRITNYISAQIKTSIVLFGFGFFVLSLLGGAPQFLGLTALCMGAASLASYFGENSSGNFRLSDTGADCLGFLFGYFIIISIPEHTFGSTIILALFTFMEIVFALLQKITMLSQFKDIKQNTACAKALSSGLPEKAILTYCIRVGLLQFIFACFQLYGNSPYSLWFICTVIIAWHQYRLINWLQLSSSIKDTNKNVVDSLRKNISTIKNSFNKTDKPK